MPYLKNSKTVTMINRVSELPALFAGLTSATKLVIPSTANKNAISWRFMSFLL
jgi:hypothetical protein